MKILSWNVNGIRAAYKNGFLSWLDSERPDVVCLQEAKAMPEQLSEEEVHPLGYNSYWNPAEKPGYSGTLLFTKTEPLSVVKGIGVSKIDAEGRVLTAEYKDFFLVNTYFPNSQRDHARLSFKLEFCSEIYRYLEGLKGRGKTVVLCGDLNIAHKEIDLKNPKSNINNAGFLPEERQWMDFFLSHGYVDGFRHFNPNPGHYTWWSYRPGVREKNIGWRLDYFVIDEESKDRLGTVEHQPEVKGSDHCPVLLRLRT